jgi:DNA polymerase-3 subunit delta'
MWQSILGHDQVVEKFRQTLAAGRLATTYLFVGLEGIGKRTLAEKLAQALLCPARDLATLEPCGHCESCRLAVAGNHPDLHYVKPRNSRYLKLDLFIGDRDHRNQEGLCHELVLRPMLGVRRVAIIDDADWFNAESANCLLKMLEEPPPHAVIILIGTSRNRQLPTILSRSQVVRFEPLAVETLSELALREGLVADSAAAKALAKRSGGSLSRARDLADPALWEMRDRVVDRWRSGRLDAPALAEDVEKFIGAAGKDAEPRRQRFRQLLSIVGESLRQALRDSAAAGQFDERALAALDRCIEAESQLDRNANQATLIESWLDDLAQLRGDSTVS